MANKTVKGFLLILRIYKSTKETVRLAPKKLDPESKADVQPEGMNVKTKENTTTKQITISKISANELQANTNHPREDRICPIMNRLQYNINGALEFFGYCDIEKASINCYIKWRRSAN